MLEGLGKPTDRRKNPNMEAHGSVHIPFHRKIGLLPAFHALGVRDVPAGTNDGEFTSPDNLQDRKDRPVDLCLGVPVAGNEEHVLANMDARFMDAERGPGPVVLALHVNIADITRCFVDRDVRVETDDLPTGPQRPKVITFDEGPSLFQVLCESGAMKETIVRRTV